VKPYLPYDFNCGKFGNNHLDLGWGSRGETHSPVARGSTNDEGKNAKGPAAKAMGNGQWAMGNGQWAMGNGQ
jgi:hypothetical protein